MNQKNILITGATRGIGKELLKSYYTKGYQVFGIYKESHEEAKKLKTLFPGIQLYAVNLENTEDTIAFITLFSKECPRLDILINNAGIYQGGGLHALTSKKLLTDFSVNVLSKFLLIQGLLPLLKKSSQPKIINISSRFGFFSLADAESISYNISNSAILMLTFALQQELAPQGVSIGCYIPTVTATDRFQSAFSANEKAAVRKSGMLASASSTATKIAKFATGLHKNCLTIDSRINTQNVNGFPFYTI